ncbi:MAG: dihydroxyacetone kinase subunit DhaK [Sebaldella sp.]|nr:dihydroxyacetone kinase subunit DhaK [Sebaldella sp.]
MKKIINKVENILHEMLEGISKAHPDILEKVENYNIIKRKDIKNKVNLISGGGSGHEPAHAGYVGYGMLDAAVAGEIFSAPTPDQILEAIKIVKSDMGVLLIIKNYTGDILNFEMAAEMAEMEGIKIEKVIVNDDIAMEDSTYTIGRRGVAGTIFIHKITGAVAEEGLSLNEVKRIAEKAIKNTKTLGMSLGPCIVPASGRASFELEEDEVEMGLGIHGEPGTHKEKLKTADEHVEYMLNKILEEQKLNEKDKVAVLINGLGATPLMELYIVNRKVSNMLEERKIVIAETLVGNYMTSLEMPGFSITILKLDTELEKYLKFKAKTPAYKN